MIAKNIMAKNKVKNLDYTLHLIQSERHCVKFCLGKCRGICTKFLMKNQEDNNTLGHPGNYLNKQQF